MLVGIQADDLTGACDTGAPFAARGLDTLVVVSDQDGPPALGPVPTVLVVDTESRTLPAETARARARTAARALGAGPPRLYYKKVDSTLRGHLAEEILGMLDGAGLPAALLAPAFPAQGRTVAGGRLRVDGRPAEETAIGRDPAFPATGGSVLALLAAGGARPVTPLPLATVRRGPDAVAERLRRFARTGGRVVAADAETEDDLALLARAGAEEPLLFAGSAGLAAALAAGLPAGRPRDQELVRPRRPLVVVAGSLHPATRAQVERLGPREGLEILTPPSDPGDPDPARRQAVARSLARATRARVERERPGTLLLTGGETAHAVLQALSAQGLRLAGLLQPGIALGALEGGPFDGLVLVTKAGGFGEADTLLRVWEAAA